jgi:hypothetical protein
MPAAAAAALLLLLLQVSDDTSADKAQDDQGEQQDEATPEVNDDPAGTAYVSCFVGCGMALVPGSSHVHWCVLHLHCAGFWTLVQGSGQSHV